MFSAYREVARKKSVSFEGGNLVAWPLLVLCAAFLLRTPPPSKPRSPSASGALPLRPLLPVTAASACQHGERRGRRISLHRLNRALCGPAFVVLPSKDARPVCAVQTWSLTARPSSASFGKARVPGPEALVIDNAREKWAGRFRVRMARFR